MEAIRDFISFQDTDAERDAGTGRGPARALQRHPGPKATDHSKPALPDRPAIMAARTGRDSNNTPTSYRRLIMSEPSD